MFGLHSVVEPGDGTANFGVILVHDLERPGIMSAFPQGIVILLRLTNLPAALSRHVQPVELLQRIHD